MAQGLLKKTPSTKPSSSKRFISLVPSSHIIPISSASSDFIGSRPHPLAPKKGARAIAPRKKKIVAQKALVKKYSAGLIRKTEASLAEKAGHLEMLSGGKKGKKGEGGEKKKKDGGKKMKK